MSKEELATLIKQAKHHLQDNWRRMTPHQRDDLKHKIKLLKAKLRS